MTLRVAVTICVFLTAACGGGSNDPNALMTPEALRALAPSMSGWDRGAINAQTIDVPEVAAVVTVSYTRGDGGQLDLEISDTGGKSSMIESLASMAGSEFNRPVGNGYLKGTTVAGAPAVESWNTENGLGELTVLIKKRYIIHVGARALPDAAPMRALVEQIALDNFK